MLGLLSSVGVGFALTDQDARVIAADQQYAAILGRPRCDVIGMTVVDVTHADDMALNRWLLAVGGPFDIRKRYLLPGGAAQWVENRVCPLELAPGKRMYLVASRPIDVPAAANARRGAHQDYGPYLCDMAGQFARIADDGGWPMAAELMRLAGGIIADDIGLKAGDEAD